MATIQELLARAQALREETALGSISPERAGSIMYDTLQQINQMQLEGGSLVISKIYASVAAMEADNAPVSDLTGQKLRQGQLVVIVPSDTSSSDMGSVYRYDGTAEDVGSWSFTGKIGGYPMDQTPTQGSTRAVTSGGVYEQITQLSGVIDKGTTYDSSNYGYGSRVSVFYPLDDFTKKFFLKISNITYSGTYLLVCLTNAASPFTSAIVRVLGDVSSPISEKTFDISRTDAELSSAKYIAVYAAEDDNAVSFKSELALSEGLNLSALAQTVKDNSDFLDGVFDKIESENLFDKSKIVPGYVSSTGGFGNYNNSTADYASSPLIPVEPNHYYGIFYRTNTSSNLVRCLDEDGVAHKVLSYGTNEEFTSWNIPNRNATNFVVNGAFKTPATAKYIQFTIRFGGTGTDNVMLIDLGDTATPYPWDVPAYQDYAPTFKLKNESIPVDLENDVKDTQDAISQVTNVSTSPNLFDKSKVIQGYYLNTGNGSFTSDDDSSVSPTIPVIPGHYYLLSGRTSSGWGIACFDQYGAWMRVLVASTGEEYSGTTWQLPKEDGSGTTANGQFKVPSAAVSVRFTTSLNGDGSLENLMLVDLGTTYIPNPIVPAYKPFGKTYMLKSEGGILSLLKGKSIRIFGGSVARLCKTWGGDAVMEAMTGCTIKNDGLDGGGFCKGTTISEGVPTFAANSIPAHVNAAVAAGQPKYDIYVLWASTNDVGQQVGTPQDYTYFDSYDVNKLLTQNGGINYCIKALNTFAPDARIIVIGSMKYFDGGANIGSAIELLMQGQKEVARLQSCPCYSLWDNVGVNYYNKDRFFTWTVDEEGESRNDGTHPNKWAYRNVIAPKIIKQIALLW